MRGLVVGLVCVFLVACLGAPAMAQGARQHSLNMRDAGSLYHTGGVRENAAHVPHAGLLGIRGRWEARSMWRTSDGHRANLPMLRVALVRDGNGGAYVTGRKLFRR